MRRSKLEVYVDVLQAINCTGQLKITQIMRKSNINGNVLKGHLDYLSNNGMIAERKHRNSKYYSLTEKGIKVLRALREVEQMFSPEKSKKSLVPTFHQPKLRHESIRQN